MNRRWRLAGLPVLLVLSACVHEEADAFSVWRAAGPAADVDAYAAFLRREGVDGIVPLDQLLRSGRRWRRCGAPPFAVPPRADWPAMAPTQRLVAALRREGSLAGAQAVSVYRDPAFNACEGGSERSRHLVNAALDFDLDPLDAAGIARLCGFWREHGARHRFGLGFYSDRQVHVDTRGHRTWGSDHRRRTSLCTTQASRSD